MKAENGQGTPIEADYCATPVRKPLRNITFALQRTAPNQACQSLHVLRFPGHKSTREGQGVSTVTSAQHIKCPVTLTKLGLMPIQLLALARQLSGS